VADGSLRLFVAVPVPPDALDACRVLIDRVRSGPAHGGTRWVRLENLHLTVRFLGATPPDLVPAVARVVRQAALAAAPFEVRLAGAGAFPAARRPRALWIGITQGADELGAMARAMNAGLTPLGWPSDSRPYRPHLTVARTDAAGGAGASAAALALESAARDWHTAFVAGEIVLYQSHLQAGPPRYEPLETIALGG
jgi:RNA 2',3'-cyclic 3'-phosphodiesterase